jgi:hypothetical protein
MKIIKGLINDWNYSKKNNLKNMQDISRIWGSHGGSYEEKHLLVCVPYGSTLERNKSLSSSNSKQWKSSACRVLLQVPCLNYFPTWRWRQYVSPKRRAVFKIHNVAAQSTGIFMQNTTSNSYELMFCFNLDPKSECSGFEFRPGDWMFWRRHFRCWLWCYLRIGLYDNGPMHLESRR